MATDILGICNRTENWLTARTFIPLAEHGHHIELATKIVKQAKNSQASFKSDEVSLELYWKGFRDYCSYNGKEKPSQEETADRYKKLFSNLSKDIIAYNKQAGAHQNLRELKPNNYFCSKEPAKQLFDNLLNTEIDIVLSAPGYLIIGEAKHEETFGTDSNLVLVHQLIRQYVMSSILADMIADNNSGEVRRDIIPFVVCDSPSQTKKTAQVQFLCYKGWLSIDNVFSWLEISSIDTSR